jgi:quercetin dioxygenase-like cupin family protein
MPIVTADNQRTFEAPLGKIVSLAAPSSGGSAELVMFRAILPPGGATSPQYHDHEEVLHVLAGRGRMRLDDEERDVTIGDTVVIPAGTVHAGTCLGDEDWDVVISMAVGTTYTAEDGTPGNPPPWMF